MDKKSNYYFEVQYNLYIDGEDGKNELIEKTSDERPFTFISGLGFALPKFEAELCSINQGDSFNFTIPTEEAYGEYADDRVLELQKEIFMRNGKFDTEHVFPGAILPMLNEDGNRLEGIVIEVKENAVIMDFNHPLSGKSLTFKGKVTTKREATDEEIQKLLNFTQGGCHCGGGCGDGGCEGGCKGNCNEEGGGCGCGNCKS